MKIGYARVSTEDQILDLQLDALNRVGCDRIFTDKQSGKDMERQGLQQALDFLREGDILVVWRLDRLGRNTQQMLSLAETLRSRKIELVSLTESIDTSTASGKMFFTIFASIAEYERELTRERIMAGLESARKRGVKGGRKRTLTKTKEKMLVQAYESNPNLTASEIAAEFGISVRSLFRCLERAKMSSSNQSEGK